MQKFSRPYGKYVLLGIDFAFAIASLTRQHLGSIFDEVLLSISRDDGYAENFQYIKLAAIIGLLGFCAISERSTAVGGWAVIFSILLLDDRLAIHERVGAKLAEWLSFSDMFNLRSIDFGEMMVFATWGIIAVVILAVTYRHNRSTVDKQIFKGLFLSLVGLAVFGGFFDMLHIVVLNSIGLSVLGEHLFEILEDGGEMVIVSLALYFIYQIAVDILAKHKELARHEELAKRQELVKHPEKVHSEIV